ncbi:GspH/FimT family pseudopilin [Vibrio gangliei]|uniref:GspH/FimT family pseudopilin n=1 Tax=Vibrio gangliei TaxID=2077090 RepID=UPI000D020386|nr:GspH/FimT family pseudopilin [Vibrio gangliei]
MARGFTLIEMLISLVVLAVLLAAAVPSFGGMSERSKMQRLAEELQGFFVQTKSEAVLRNQPVYLNFVKIGSEYSGEWGLATRASATPATSLSSAQSDALVYLDGHPFKNITVNFPMANGSTLLSVLEFEPVNGKPIQPSSLSFFVDANKPLKLVFSNVTGRIRICGDGGAFYGYPSCE